MDARQESQVAYLPIENLRLPGDRRERGARVFYSSGTTGGGRSEVPFSDAGLIAYQKASVHTFIKMLDEVLPGGAAAARGLSLVPPVGDWPDSSLAQMIAWIGERLSMTYCTAESLGDGIRRAGDRPVWVFGTAFHLVNLLDAHLARTLPLGSVVIETGGLKGRVRDVSRADLYKELSVAFQMPEEQVVSEYGMCELACQAYDYVPRGARCALVDRRFRFPDWVTPLVLTGPGEIAASGRGALIVDDPRRLDQPLPLRTEDLVELFDDGSFVLLGRVAKAPLKGCSLNVETLPAAPHGARPAPAPRAPPHDPRVAAFIKAPTTHALLTQELGSASAARAALDDLTSGLPTTPEEWRDAVANSRSNDARRWLVILPDNHSLVGIYPLTMAALAGLDVTVRLPERFRKNSVIAAYVDHLGLKTTDARLGGSDVPEHDAILAYGSDETLAHLRTLTTAPIKGFGHLIGVTVVSPEDFTARADDLARDALGLGQTGCMSTRLIAVRGPVTSRALEQLAEAGARFWNAEIPWQARVGLDFEARRLERLGFRLFEPDDTRTPLVAYGAFSADAVARAPFTLTVVETASVFLHSVFLHSVLLPGAWSGPLGKVQAPKWDGSHAGQILF